VSKYEIADEWNKGFRWAVCLLGPCMMSESDHWIAGYKAGYELRKQRGQLLNDYLTSIGVEQMAIFTINGEAKQ
jgi:hypothetical protein